MTDITVTTTVEEIWLTVEGSPTIALTTEAATEVVISPVGLQGPPGAGSARYTHTQASASALWIINHNLGAVPLVQAFSAGSVAIEGAVDNPTVNQTRIAFNAAVSGFAICQ